MVLRLAGTELAEIFSGFGDYVGEELELDAPEWLPWWMLGG